MTRAIAPTIVYAALAAGSIVGCGRQPTAAATPAPTPVGPRAIELAGVFRDSKGRVVTVPVDWAWGTGRDSTSWMLSQRSGEAPRWRRVLISGVPFSSTDGPWLVGEPQADGRAADSTCFIVDARGFLIVIGDGDSPSRVLVRAADGSPVWKVVAAVDEPAGAGEIGWLRTPRVLLKPPQPDPMQDHEP